MQNNLEFLTAGKMLNYTGFPTQGSDRPLGVFKEARWAFIHSCLTPAGESPPKSASDVVSVDYSRADRMLTRVYNDVTAANLQQTIHNLLSSTTDHPTWIGGRRYLSILWMAAGQFETLDDALQEWSGSQERELACFAVYSKGLSLQIRGRNLEALDAFLELQADDTKAQKVGWMLDASTAGAFRELGQKDRSEEYLSKVESHVAQGDVQSDYNRACICALKGDGRGALRLLQRAYDNREGFCIVWCRVDPDLKILHDDPKFVALMDRIEEETRVQNGPTAAQS